jgi:RsiW-degrading membrane proteinase PrsW (M82 family)
MCKFLILIGYCSRRQAFDEPMDGVIYGVTASLGFATVENIAYVVGGTWQLALARGLAAVPMHAFLGVLLGYYVGQAHRHPERLSMLANGLLFVILLHALYDFPLLALYEMDLRGQTPSTSLALLLYSITFSLLAIAGFSAVGIVRRLRQEQGGQPAPSEQP